jgi:hypothetical protein
VAEPFRGRRPPLDLPRAAEPSKEYIVGKINWGRVLLGGLLAGLIINIVEFIMNMYVLKQQWADAMKSLGKAAEYGTGAMVIFIIIGFAAGIGMIWLYAAIRPRFGPGVKTAICAALAVWLYYGVLPTIMFLAMNFFPTWLLNIGAAYGLVELVVASIAGAALYKEA